MNRAQRRARKRNRVEVGPPVKVLPESTPTTGNSNPESGLFHESAKGVDLTVPQGLFDMSEPLVYAKLAQLLSVSRQAVSAAVADGRIPDGPTLGDALAGAIDRLREQAAGRLGHEVGGLDLSQERAALAREMRMGHEIKNAVARGTYAPIELLAEILATASQSIVERFEQLPGQIAKACPDLPEAARVQVMACIASARNEWVRTTEKLVAQKVLGPDDDGAETGEPRQ